MVLIRRFDEDGIVLPDLAAGGAEEQVIFTENFEALRNNSVDLLQLPAVKREDKILVLVHLWKDSGQCPIAWMTRHQFMCRHNVDFLLSPLFLDSTGFEG